MTGIRHGREALREGAAVFPPRERAGGPAAARPVLAALAPGGIPYIVTRRAVAGLVRTLHGPRACGNPYLEE